MKLMELINSDYEIYGGGTAVRSIEIYSEWNQETHIVKMDLPPFTGRLFKMERVGEVNYLRRIKLCCIVMIIRWYV